MIFKGSVFASKEGVAGLLCIMLGALFTYVFIENGTLSKRSKSFLEPSGIGHLQPLSDGVRLRSIDSAIWQDVPSKHKKEVGLGDAIFTSKNASARVGMKDGTEVVIQPASMVVFSKPKKIKGSVSVERNVIQVKKGQVKLSVKKNASIPVVIEVSGKNYEIPVKDIASDAERTLLVSLDEGKEKPVVAVVEPETVRVEPETVRVEPERPEEVPIVQVPIVQVQVEEVKMESFPEPAVPSAEPVIEMAQEASKMPIGAPTPEQVANTIVADPEAAPVRFTAAEIKRIDVRLPPPPEAPIKLPEKTNPAPKETLKVTPVAEVPKPDQTVRIRIEESKGTLQITASEPKPLREESPVVADERSQSGLEQSPASPAQPLEMPVPETSPAPVAVAEVQQDPKAGSGGKESESTGFIEAKLGNSFMKFEGRDTSNGSTGTLGSSSSVRLEADWITRLNRDSRLAFGMRFHKVEIMDLENFTLQGASQSLMEIHSEYRTLLSREWGLLVGAGQRDHLFYRAVSTSAIKIDKIPALYGQFELSYEFSPGPFMRGALRGGLSIHAPVSFDAYHSKTGTGYSGAFRWTQDFNSLSFFAEPFYRKDAIPLEGLDYTETELGLGFGLLFPLK